MEDSSELSGLSRLALSRLGDSLIVAHNVRLQVGMLVGPGGELIKQAEQVQWQKDGRKV